VRRSRRHIAEANARSTTPTEVPPGWQAGSLGDAIRLQPGYAFKSEWFAKEGVKLLRGVNIEPGRTRWQDVVYLAANRVNEFAPYGLGVGDVVIAMDRPIISTGLKVAALQEQDVPSLLLQRVGRFRCGETVERPFLLHYLRSHLFIQHVDRQATGTQLPHISATDIETAPFLLPPLNEQRRIVAKLEALQARSRRAREALDAVPPLLEKLRQSILAAAFRGDLTKDWRAKHKNVEPASELLKRIRTERRKKWEETELAKMNAKGKTPTDDKWKAKYKEPEPVDATGLPELPEGWCWASAEEVVASGADIVYGIVQPGPPLEKGIPYVRGTDIQGEKILVDQLWRTSESIAADYSRSTIRAGDVLLCIIRHLKVAVVPPALDGGNLSRTTARLRPSLVVRTAYLADVLRSPLCQLWLKSNYRGGTSMPKVNIADVLRLPIAVAPLAEQDAISARLESLQRPLTAMQGGTHGVEAMIAQLDQSVLAKAFRGELVPQDPNDEPAEEMLARSRGANGAPDNARTRRSRTKAGVEV
jgi:type I restriction enzyme S subunit